MYRIILVDDEPWVLSGLNRIVDWNSLGFSVEAVTLRSSEAWELLQALQPDAVITDIRMPNISGLQLLERAREAGLDAEFIVISGFNEFEYAQNALNSGAFYYLLKPLEAEKIVDVMKRLKASLDDKAESRDLKKHRLIQKIVQGSDQKTTVQELFALNGKACRDYGIAVLKESPFDEPEQAIVSSSIDSLTIRLSYNRTLYLISCPQLPGNIFSLPNLLPLIRKGVSISVSDLLPSYVSAYEIFRNVDQKMCHQIVLKDHNRALEPEAREEPDYRYHYGLQKIIEFIDEHYCEPISLESIAEQFHFSFSHICHTFRRVTGTTFLQYVTNLRLNKAQELLISTGMSISEIAEATGYPDYYYFNRIFKKKFGFTPTVYRKDAANEKF